MPSLERALLVLVRALGVVLAFIPSPARPLVPDANPVDLRAFPVKKLVFVHNLRRLPLVYWVTKLRVRFMKVSSGNGAFCRGAGFCHCIDSAAVDEELAGSVLGHHTLFPILLGRFDA